MSYVHINTRFKMRVLSLSISLLFIPYAYALQPIDDEDLGESTGGAIAFLPENFSLLFQGENAVNPTATDLADRTKDTGYIRYIPVGPLTTEATSNPIYGTKTGKGDLYLYGLAISQSTRDYGVGRSSTDWNNRFSRPINTWGTAGNPWVFKVATAANVPNFSAITPTDTGSGSVTYLALEAPRYDVDISALSAAEKSAYNLKLAFWADAFVRDPRYAEATGAAALASNQFCLAGATGCATAATPRANRLRLQAIWDGFSLNGSQLQVFQTLGDATNTGGMSTFYNNTLGIAGVLRFNSGDGTNVRATTSQSASITATAATKTWTTINDGNAAACNNGSATTAPAYTNVNCQNRTRVSQATNTATSTWTLPATASVLRFSTRETGTTQGLLNSPAVNGGAAPTFEDNEGLFAYNANINLVLGSLYQPLTVGVAPDGKNLTLEIARIPNKESIYKKVYINYQNFNPATNGGYTGSTCNFYECGAAAGGYQGTTATHSSISIGSTQYNTGTKALTAYKGVEAYGISFGALSSNSVTVVTQYTEIQNQLRRQTSHTYGAWGGSTANEWQYLKADGTYGTPDSIDAANPSLNNRSWTYATTNVPAAWVPIASTTYGGGYTATANIPGAAQNTPVVIPSNNLGSAVIDGLLIQHMKITTKGL